MREIIPLTQRPITRRQAMMWFGASSALWLMDGKLAEAQSTADVAGSLCIVRPEQTEGPYFVDERLNRSDIRSDPTDGRVIAGTPLTLMFRVMRFNANTCQPLTDAQVDIWHCDAAGVYSDVEDPGFSTIGQKFLRGYQVTNAQGEARFTTIYPGWYPIRTVHIHFKIRTASVARKSFEFTSQVYFPDEVTDRVHASPPYSSKGVRRVRNRHDFIFRQDGGQLVVDPSPPGNGYAATFPIGLELP